MPRGQDEADTTPGGEHRLASVAIRCHAGSRILVRLGRARAYVVRARAAHSGKAGRNGTSLRATASATVGEQGRGKHSARRMPAGGEEGRNDDAKSAGC